MRYTVFSHECNPCGMESCSNHVETCDCRCSLCKEDVARFIAREDAENRDDFYRLEESDIRSDSR